MSLSKLDQREIPLSQIQIVRNVRRQFDTAKLNDLARSIKKDGIIQPLLVRPHPSKPNHFQLVIGERRMRGAQLAGLAAVPCDVRDLDDKKVAELQLIENDQREDLRATERAVGYQALIDKHGHTPATIASTVNRSREFVYRTLKLLKAPKLAIDALDRGEISVHTVAGIARIPSEAAREKAAREIIRDNYTGAPLSERLAAAHIERHYMRELKSAPFDPNDAKLTKAGSCETCPKRTGNNREEFPEGRADVCTDPICFVEKVAAAERLIQIEPRPSRPDTRAEEQSKPAPGKTIDDMRARLSDRKRRRAAELEQRLLFLKQEFTEIEFNEILNVAVTAAHRLAQSSRKSDRDLFVAALEKWTVLEIEELTEETGLSRWVAENIGKALEKDGLVLIRPKADPNKSGGRPRLEYSLTHSRK